MYLGSKRTEDSNSINYLGVKTSVYKGKISCGMYCESTVSTLWVLYTTKTTTGTRYWECTRSVPGTEIPVVIYSAIACTKFAQLSTVPCLAMNHCSVVNVLQWWCIVCYLYNNNNKHLETVISLPLKSVKLNKIPIWLQNISNKQKETTTIKQFEYCCTIFVTYLVNFTKWISF